MKENADNPTRRWGWSCCLRLPSVHIIKKITTESNMKLLITFFLMSTLLACGGGGSSSSTANEYNAESNSSDDSVDQSNDTNDNDDTTFTLSSTAFSSGDEIPVIHACANSGGNNYSPQLSWQNAPENTDSFVLIVDDETAPCGTGAEACVHWNLFNIDGSVSSLTEDVSTGEIVDEGGTSSVVEGLTYADTNDYEGPCPPPGNAHTYFFKIYALSSDHPEMEAAQSLTSSDFEADHGSHILGEAEINGTFSSD